MIASTIALASSMIDALRHAVDCRGQLPFRRQVLVVEFVALVHGCVALLDGAKPELLEFDVAVDGVTEIQHGKGKAPDLVGAVTIRNPAIEVSGGDPVGGLCDFDIGPTTDSFMTITLRAAKIMAPNPRMNRYEGCVSSLVTELGRLRVHSL